MALIANHGGGCCGMSHIHTFCGRGAACKQCADGFSQLIKKVENGRPKGIIEVVLTTSQKEMWQSEMDKYGFKEVNSCVNSNTGNTIHVFHRNSGEVPPIS